MIQKQAICSFILLLATVLFPMLLIAQVSTIQVTLSSEFTDEISFQPSRVSETEARHWILLSEHGPYTDPTVILPACDGERGKTPEKMQESIKKAKLELSDFRTKTAELGSDSYPPELTEIVSYLTRLRNLWTSVDSQVLSFYETGNASSLIGPVGAFEQPERCQRIVNRVQKTLSVSQARKLVCHDWNNCILDEGTKRLGKYPTEVWKAFTERYGIHEHLIFNDAD